MVMVYELISYHHSSASLLVMVGEKDVHCCISGGNKAINTRHCGPIIILMLNKKEVDEKDK